MLLSKSQTRWSFLVEKSARYGMIKKAVNQRGGQNENNFMEC